ncbi:hypothetical protein [Micromonospora sp. NPDC001898]|uniref:hypothetical protein n=1 Tax=Micromonospora sp. NPDC001898 TaxID=3364221 RepID=UPI003683F698
MSRRDEGVGDQGKLGGLFDGFEGYRNVERAGLSGVLRSGIVALDTNPLFGSVRGEGKLWGTGK